MDLDTRSDPRREFCGSSKELEVTVDYSQGEFFRVWLRPLKSLLMQRGWRGFPATHGLFSLWGAWPMGSHMQGGSDWRGPWHPGLDPVGRDSSLKDVKYSGPGCANGLGRREMKQALARIKTGVPNSLDHVDVKGLKKKTTENIW